MLRPCSTQVGMSCQPSVAVTLGPAGRRCGLKTQTGRWVAALPLPDALARIVGVRVDMAAGELDRRLGAALEGDIGDLDSRLLGDHARQELVGVLRLGAAHLELGLLARLDVILGGLDRAVLLDPEQELVLRHRGDGGEIGVLIGELRGHRLRPGVRGPEDHLVGVAGLRLAVDVALGAAAARLVDHHHRLVDELVLGDDALDRAGEVVGAPAGPRRRDELDRLRRLPLGGGDLGQNERRACGENGGDGGSSLTCFAPGVFHVVSGVLPRSRRSVDPEVRSPKG